MNLGERVYLYCERGTNEALWAEPINAISNAGFFLAALIFWQLVLWRPPEQRSPDHYLLVALTFLIGMGSLSFHLYADRATELADVVPIVAFMLVYFGVVLNRFLNVPPGWTVFLAIVFAGLIGASTQVVCWNGGIGFSGVAPEEAKPCLNGSVGYLPALGALIVVGMLLAERRHKAAPYLLAATLIFAGSILFRSLDMSLCQQVVIEGRNVGTHFIWHLLNALVVFLLLCATLQSGTRPETVKTAKEPEKDAPEPPGDSAKTGAVSEPKAKDDATEEAETAEKDEAEPVSETDSRRKRKRQWRRRAKTRSRTTPPTRPSSPKPEETPESGDAPQSEDASTSKDNSDAKGKSK